MFDLRKPGDLNDPFEIRPVLTRISTSAERIASFHEAATKEIRNLLPKLDEQQANALTKKLLTKVGPRVEPFIDRAMKGAVGIFNNKIFPDSINKVFGVLSLSESPKSSLMWAHYGETYQGVAIEFDTASDCFRSPDGVHDDFGRLRKVIYSDTRPEWDFGNEATPSLEFLYTKPREWSYEVEWRMLRPLKLASTVIERDPFSINLFPIPPGAIRSVILGFRVSKETFDSVSEALEKSPGLRGATMQAAIPGTTSFQLEVIPVKKWEQLRVDSARAEDAMRDVVASLEESNASADQLSPALIAGVLSELRKGLS